VLKVKKYFLLFICCAMMAAIFAGCTKSAADDGVAFVATVLDKNETSILVEPVEGSMELKTADRIIVYIEKDTRLKLNNAVITMEDIEIGSRVEIFYQGDMAESYPAQIYSCYEIRLLDFTVFIEQDENFVVKTYIDKLTFDENEEIIMYSTLEYIGEKENITLWSGEPYFHHEILNEEGEYFNQGITLTILKTTVLEKGETYIIPFSKSGSYTEDDPRADFWKEYFSEKELRLPSGDYTFKAYTEFSLDEDQTERVNLSIEFEVRVE